MTIGKNLLFVVLILGFVTASAQTFTNGDLNGNVNFVSVPTSWTQIPDTDPICQANTPAEATVDVLDATGPNQVGGVAGIPQSGNTFCSGLHASDNGAFLWHEGIMQTVNGFTPGTQYAVSFYQTVVKQQNTQDPSGSWSLYLDGTLIGTSAVSVSALAFDDVNLVWDCRVINFTATAASHVLKFIPQDDDADLTNNAASPNGGLRMGIDLIEFTVPVDPTIAPAGPFCLNEPSVNLSAADPGGTWSGNGITNPAGGTFDPAAAGLGNHDVVYSIPVGCGFLRDTLTISIVNGTSSGWTAPGTLCINSGVINLDALVTGTPGGTWSGLGVVGSSFDPSAGTSAVSYSVGVPPCNSDSTITIPVDALDDASFSFPQNSYCLLDPNPTPNITGLMGGTFSIDNGGIIDANTGEVDLNGSGLGNYIVTYQTSGPCPNSTTFNLAITNTSDATITPAGPFCQSDPALALIAATPGGNWSATCGACIDINSGVFDPAIAGVGTHTITYTLLGACGDVQNTNIDVVSSANATITPIGPFCIGNPNVFLNAVDPGGTWSGNGIIDITTGEFDPAAAGAGNHTITYTIPGACGSQGTTQIVVNTALTLLAFVDQTICEGANANLSALASGGDGNYTYSWTDDLGSPAGATASIVVTPIVTTTYTITVSDLCGSTVQSANVVVTVEALPIVDFTPDQVSGCPPLEVNFTDNTAPAGNNCLWDFGDTFVSINCGNASHTYTEEGCYDVTYTVTSANGCSGSATFPDLICVSPFAVANFDCIADDPNVLDPNIDFVNQSVNATNYSWDFGDGHTSIETNPSHAFNQGAGDYNVCLTAMNDDNCNSTACKIVTIKDQFSIYVPNAFTPNGDGANDVFIPVLSGFQEDYYELLIFDRWGEVIFESNSSSYNWPGTDPSGVQAKVDIYVWKIKVRQTDSYVDEEFIGHVTIVR